MSFSVLKTWLSTTKNTAFGSTKNKIITLIATSAILTVSIGAFVKYQAYRNFKAKKRYEAQKRTFYKNQLPKGNNLKAPEPGTIVINDFRQNKNNIEFNSNVNTNTTIPNSSISSIPNPKHIRIITWNIERGYQINEIIQQLKAINADIILLQEVDIGCKRTNMLDIGNEIANALKYQIIYGTDCWHINDYHENDPNANKDIKWNSLPHNGSEGNAILTRYDIIKGYSVIMPCVRNRYRPSHDHMKRHTAVVGIIDIPDFGELVCYSLHMDAFSGRTARSTIQYRAIYEDIIQHHTQSDDNDNKNDIDDDGKGVIKKRRAVVVGGDFNTHNHGIARFLNEMSGDDELRYKFWGISEAEWWDRFVIDKEIHIVSNLIPSKRIRLKDPFNKNNDITAFKLWKGFNVWSGKIDWFLYDYDKLIVINKYVSDINASDHAYLLCDLAAKR